MKSESGTPAFENIDDLLTEKIVTHGHDHADRTATQIPADDPDRQAAPAEHFEPGGGPSKKTIIVAFLILGMLLLIVYRLFNRQQNR
jgi:hypothetical protein